MKYAIFGAGPCGCYLAYHLAKNGHSVTLYEKENTLLGCWATHRVDGKFTEHAPRVLFSNYYNTFDFFKEIGIDFKKEFFYVHNVLLQSLTEFSFSFSDVLVFSYIYLFSSLYYNTPVSYFLPFFTSNGKKRIEEYCYLWDGTPPEKFSVTSFSDTIDKFLLYSMYLPKTDSDVYYLPRITSALLKYNVTIKTEHQLDYISDNLPYVKSYPVYSDHYILCIPPKQFVDVLAKSSVDIRDNWGQLSTLRNKLHFNYYTAIGVQFHFTSKIKYSTIKHLPHIFGDWKICWDVKNNYVSTAILNYHHLHNLSKSDLIKGVWSQMSTFVSLPHYSSATVTSSIFKEKNQWSSTQGAYCNSYKYSHFVPYLGKNKKFSYVGSHNPTKNTLFPVTSHESAIMCAQYWLNKNSIPIYIHYPLSFFTILLLVVLTIFLIILFNRK